MTGPSARKGWLGLRGLAALGAPALLATSYLGQPASALYTPAEHQPQPHPICVGPGLDRLGRRTDALADEAPPAQLGPYTMPDRVPMKITNDCESTLWPGITTQHGTGPGVHGFELASGESVTMYVDPMWQGRIWGRTNCTVNGESANCLTGDCWKRLDCAGASGEVPATLSEINLAGGYDNAQVYYDISLVDGYNLPMAIRYLPFGNGSFIPPNLSNPSCIATPGWLGTPGTTSGTIYSNSTYPIPWESEETDDSVRQWCPWDLLKFPPQKPGDGVYAYPDDNIRHPDFSPCLSACAKHGTDEDCCTGDYHDPAVCKPSYYSRRIKKVCPDAYSYAFDDTTSTFIIPSHMGGFETLFCPRGRSTKVIQVLGAQMQELSQNKVLSTQALEVTRDADYINEAARDSGADTNNKVSAAFAGMVAIAGLLLLF